MNWRSQTAKSLVICFCLLLCSLFLSAQEIPGALREQVDALAHKTLSESGVPSASIAIVQAGAITFA
ncbi:MAG: hypothetical protein WBQ00_16155, partial [Terriglobales bacterium]